MRTAIIVFPYETFSNNYFPPKSTGLCITGKLKLVLYVNFLVNSMHRKSNSFVFSFPSLSFALRMKWSLHLSYRIPVAYINFPLPQQRDSTYSRLGLAMESPMAPSWTPRNHYKPPGSKGYLPPELPDQGVSSYHFNTGSSAYGTGGDPSRTTTSSRDEASVSISNASDVESEWIEQDEPGVYITIRQLADGSRELRRVRFG